MNKLILWTFAVTCAVALSSQNAKADVLYSNLAPPSGTYEKGGAYTIGPAVVGNAFTMANGGTLSDIGIALDHVSGSDSVTVSLFADAGGTPGVLLEAWTAVVTTPFGSSDSALVDLVSVNHPFLAAGTAYWVIATSDPWNGWNFNTIGAVGPHDFEGSFSTDTEGAIQFNSTSNPVSEPGSMFLVCTGLIGAAGTVRRKLVV